MTKSLAVILQPPLDAFAEGVSNQAEPVKSGTVYGALSDICERRPALRERLFEGQELSPFVNVFLNGNLIPADRCREQTIADRDELCLLTAIRGG